MQKYILWIATGIVTLIMLMGGYGKLSGNPMMHGAFAALGLPLWFGYFIGASEIAGAIGIWIPRLATLAATGVCCIMAGALYFHLMFTPLNMGIPALAVLICAAYVAVRRRDQAFWVH